MVQRVALVNPTKFLGNLMIAGRLLQSFAQECQRNDVELLLVLDLRYRALLEPALPGARLVWYPRDALVSARRPEAWKAWWLCVRAIRRFRADLAFPIEDDSVAHQLTRLSRARHRIGNSKARSSLGLHEVVPVPRSDRQIQRRHVWFAYREVFERLGLAANLPERPCYMRLPVSAMSGSKALLERLASMGVHTPSQCVVLHAGATKRYKMWPVTHFMELARLLLAQGRDVVLIGAGEVDACVNRSILSGLQGQARQPVDLVDRLSLPELACLFRHVRAVVGNDSGPMHLAGASGAAGLVIFGPTDGGLWHPLSESIRMIDNHDACDPRCRRRTCYREYACLRGITPQRVLDRLVRGWL